MKVIRVLVDGEEVTLTGLNASEFMAAADATDAVGYQPDVLRFTDRHGRRTYINRHRVGAVHDVTKPCGCNPGQARSECPHVKVAA